MLSPWSSVRVARLCLAMCLVALFVGTLMPGAWREAGARPFAAYLDMSAAAHVVLFAAIAVLMPPSAPGRVRAWHIVAAGLGLALLTEGLQHFAVNRHPSLTGVAQDVAGTLMGWAWVLRRSLQLRRAA